MHLPLTDFPGDSECLRFYRKCGSPSTEMSLWENVYKSPVPWNAYRQWGERQKGQYRPHCCHSFCHGSGDDYFYGCHNIQKQKAEWEVRRPLYSKKALAVLTIASATATVAVTSALSATTVRLEMVKWRWLWGTWRARLGLNFWL